MYRSGNGRSPHNTNFEFQYMSKTVEKGRSAKTGQFVPIEYAQKHPDTTVVEKSKSARQSTESDFRMCLNDVNRLGSIFQSSAILLRQVPPVYAVDSYRLCQIIYKVAY